MRPHVCGGWLLVASLLLVVTVEEVSHGVGKVCHDVPCHEREFSSLGGAKVGGEAVEVNA